MLQVSDIRQTRVFQEALEEGEEKGRKKGREEVAIELLKLEHPIAEIAKATGLSAARLRKLKKEHRIK